MKEGCNKAAVDFLISNLLKRAFTKHKKGTETSVNPAEDQSVEDHDESLKKCLLFVIRIFSYMDRIVSDVFCIWTEY